MFGDNEALVNYVIANYPEVSDARVDEDHWDLFCGRCNVVRGFQFIRYSQSVTKSSQYGNAFRTEWHAPLTYVFRCPVCGAFKQWVMFGFLLEGDNKRRFFKVTSIPNEGFEEIEELPAEPASLRIAYREAVRAADANAPLASAAMFRRAVQIITRDVLKVKPGTLAAELKSLVGKEFNGTRISNTFSDNAYVIREAGNQGAHPDSDPDLMSFTADDATDLRAIFMELVAELFVIPAARLKAKSDFMARRKITAPLRS